MCQLPNYAWMKTDHGRKLSEWPCGHCSECLNKRANEWLVRLHYESKNNEHAHFITLTFEQAPRSPNGYLTAPKDELQRYFKRLRKIANRTGIKYYACSEYGEKNHRPHYHAIIFGVQDSRHYLRAWNQQGQGIIDVADVTPASIRYVTGYIEKRIGIPWTPDDDRQPEFSLMSKNMGLSFLDQAYLWNAKYEKGTTKIGKNTYLLPRYYKDILWPDIIEKWKEPSSHLKKKDGTPQMITRQITRIPNTIKKRIGEKNALKKLEIQISQMASFPSKLDYYKNLQALAERDNKSKQFLIKTSK